MTCPHLWPRCIPAGGQGFVDGGQDQFSGSIKDEGLISAMIHP
jgi:hypothetical protein